MRKFVKHILGNNTRRNREQRPGVQTTNSTPVDRGSGGNNVGNRRHHRPDRSSPRVANTDVSEVVTEQTFGEHLLLEMRERRAVISKRLFKKKCRELVHRCQVPTNSLTDMTTLIKAQQAELHRLYIACARTSEISTGTVLHACMFSCKWICQYALTFVLHD